jgi:hypothetical protein
MCLFESGESSITVHIMTSRLLRLNDDQMRIIASDGIWPGSWLSEFHANGWAKRSQPYGGFE